MEALFVPPSLHFSAYRALEGHGRGTPNSLDRFTKPTRIYSQNLGSIVAQEAEIWRIEVFRCTWDDIAWMWREPLTGIF